MKMNDQNNNLDIEKPDKETNNDESPEKSLFSTIMRGTPNLLDLLDPAKVSESAFTSHRKSNLAKIEKKKPEPIPVISKPTPLPTPIVIEQAAPNETDNHVQEEPLGQMQMPNLPILMEEPEPEPESEPKKEEEEQVRLVQMDLFKVSSEDISTLYLKNLSEKVNLKDLKYSLNFLFSQFGKVIAIQVSKKNKLRGQAFVTFAKPAEARKALKSIHGFSFFEKELHVQLAKTKSLASFIYEGKFHNLSDRIHALRKSKVGIKTMLKDTEPAEAKHLLRKASHILSVQNFPETLNADRFKLLFRQFPGFKSARLVPEKKVGLVEFYDKVQAMIALKKYEGFMIDDQHLLKVRFAQHEDGSRPVKN